VDSGLVDAEALRGVWSAARPDFRTATLLQAAWLGSGGERRACVQSSRGGGVRGATVGPGAVTG
jgi:hypothetical protein